MSASFNTLWRITGKHNVNNIQAWLGLSFFNLHPTHFTFVSFIDYDWKECSVITAQFPKHRWSWDCNKTIVLNDKRLQPKKTKTGYKMWITLTMD